MDKKKRVSAITHNEIAHSKYSIFCGRDPESEIGDPEKYFGRLGLDTTQPSANSSLFRPETPDPRSVGGLTEQTTTGILNEDGL